MIKIEVLKRVVIKEEFVALTKDFKKAVILNQFLYWSERVKDFDRFIKEENKRMNNNDIDDKPIELQHGWIYKKAEELSSETMLGVSKQTIGRLTDDLCKNKWIEKRRNPKYKWDKTFQYRVNIVKIAQDLQKIGYTLQGYKVNMNDIITSSKMEFQALKMELYKYQNGTAIPENTSKNTKQNLREGLGNPQQSEKTLTVKDYCYLVNKDLFDTDTYKSMCYFISKRNHCYGKNTKLKANTWERLFSSWFTVEINGKEKEVEPDTMKIAVDNFFNTRFKDSKCDYSIILFEKVKAYRIMEIGAF